MESVAKGFTPPTRASRVPDAALADQKDATIIPSATYRKGRHAPGRRSRCAASHGVTSGAPRAHTRRPSAGMEVYPDRYALQSPGPARIRRLFRAAGDGAVVGIGDDAPRGSGGDGA